MNNEPLDGQDEKEQPNIAQMMESLSAMNETLNGINEQIESLKEDSKPIETTPEPLPLDKDPENLPPENWKKLREEIKSEAERKAEEKWQAKENEKIAKEEEIKKAESEWDDKFEKEAEEAMKQGFLPEIKDENDHNDPGNVSRRDLFGFAHFLNQTDLLKVAETVKLYNEQGKHFDIDQNKWIQSEYRAAGKSVPVGSSANRVSSPTNDMSYKELHNSSLDTLARKAKAKYGII